MALGAAASVKRMMELGEAGVGRIAGQLLANDRFVAAVGAVVSTTLAAKGTLDRSLRAALATMNLPSTADVEAIAHKLDDIERLLGDLEARLSRLEGGAPEEGEDEDD